MANHCISISHPEIQELAKITKQHPAIVAAKAAIWQEKNNTLDRFPTSEELRSSNQVNYSLKAVDILISDKAKQVFEKGIKNNWPLDKILTELQVPKEQKQIILDRGHKILTHNDARLSNEPDLREQIITDLLANYSYTVEINTATEQKPSRTNEGRFDETEGFSLNNLRYITDGYGMYITKDENGNLNDIKKSEYNKAKEEFQKNNTTDTPTQYYSNLTVPGGTNGSYIEANIETPMIVPSIQSHAQFKTDNTIGWMRADEKQNYQEKDIDNLIEIMKKSGILEVNCG